MLESNFLSKGYRTSNRKHHNKLFKRILNLQLALSYLQFINDVKTTFMCLIFPEEEMMGGTEEDKMDIKYLKMHQ